MTETIDVKLIEVFIGIDMGKEAHYANAITNDGDELFHMPVANDEAAINTLINRASEHGRAAFAIDQPASGAQLLIAAARVAGIPVAYITGLQMRRAAELYAGQAKTDPLDAQVLADFARRNADRRTWLDATDEMLMNLRVINGRDVDLAEDANRASNRLRDALTAISPTLERAIGVRLGDAGIRDLLKKYPTPTALNAAGKTKITTCIAKRSPRIATKVSDQIMVALLAQTITLPGESAWGEVIADLAGDLERIHARRKEIVVQVEELFHSHPLGQVLVTLCGFGPRTGARTLAEIGDPNRFADGGRLASYAGVAPVDRRSGKSINHTGRARAGNHRLKNAMFIAAFVASQHDPEARAYYQRKRSEGKKHNAAIICLARKRCDLILAMLKTGTAYQKPESENEDHLKAA